MKNHQKFWLKSIHILFLVISLTLGCSPVSYQQIEPTKFQEFINSQDNPVESSDLINLYLFDFQNQNRPGMSKFSFTEWSKGDTYFISATTNISKKGHLKVTIGYKVLPKGFEIVEILEQDPL